MRNATRWMGLAAMLLLACSSSEDTSPPDLADDNVGAGGSSSSVATGSSGVSEGGANPTTGTTGSGGSLSNGGSLNGGGSQNGAGSQNTGGSQNAGGSQNTGGSRDADGGATPQPMPLPCDQLPPAGTWQQITPKGAGPGASSVAVDPLHPGVLYTGTVEHSNVWGGPGNGLWKSTDCGASWKHIDTGQNAAKIDPGSLVYILISSSDSSLMYTNSLYGGLGLYKSTTGGVDWSDITPKGQGLPDFVLGEALDPNDGNHLLMTFHDNCSAPHAALCIGETLDGGTTWRIFDGPPDVHGWAEQAGLFFLDRSTWLFGAPSNGLYYTTDAGAHWQQKLGYPGCHGFGKLIHTGGKYYLPCWGGVAQSPNGTDWELIPGSPHAIALELAENTLYASFVIDSSGNPFWSAPLSNTKTWSTVATGHTFSSGAFHFAYDSNHHVLYTADFAGGVWRVVTP